MKKRFKSFVAVALCIAMLCSIAIGAGATDLVSGEVGEEFGDSDSAIVKELPSSISILQNMDGTYCEEFSKTKLSKRTSPNSIQATMTHDNGVYQTEDGTFIVESETGVFFPKERVEIDLTNLQNLEEIINQYDISKEMVESLRSDSKNCLDYGLEGTSVVYLTPRELINSPITRSTNTVNYYTYNGVPMYDDLVYNYLYTRPFSGKGSTVSNLASVARTVVVRAASDYWLSLINTGYSLYQNFYTIVSPKYINPSYSDEIYVDIGYARQDKYTCAYYPNERMYRYCLKTTSVSINEINTLTYLCYTNSSGGTSTRRVNTTRYPGSTYNSRNYNNPGAWVYANCFPNGYNSLMPIYAFDNQAISLKIDGLNSTFVNF